MIAAVAGGDDGAAMAVRPAGADELEVVLRVLRATVVRPRGDAGPTWGTQFPDVERDIGTGRVYLGRLGDEPAGCFVLSWADESMWGGDDGDAGYLHRLAVRPVLAGRGLGEQLIAKAHALTASAGRRWLRLDCERDNAALRRYYERLGFCHVRDESEIARTTRPGVRSASLYQQVVAAGTAGP